MTRWTNIRTFKTAQFKVTLDHTYDEDTDLSWADEETLLKIDSGKWGCYLFRVAVFWRGEEIGRDYLGGSVYADPRDFAAEHRPGGSYFSDMVRSAIAEARTTLTQRRPYIRTAA